ncbi:hypothetical protein PACTADRAFT_45943 [Pachysolen tannophilus NRRL Y-2460]|uniref:Carboxypeptidase n=1 Tax=Pachysolen tannophilus NRRL Y-2460 TaxID=669874 RepID=A0A1E4TPW4_PACTA|nr:hypothetical protein PACTADRAFT_45943 [Pachysolen tannophilus NRRL Y-2460]
MKFGDFTVFVLFSAVVFGCSGGFCFKLLHFGDDEKEIDQTVIGGDHTIFTHSNWGKILTSSFFFQKTIEVYGEPNIEELNDEIIESWLKIESDLNEKEILKAIENYSNFLNHFSKPNSYKIFSNNAKKIWEHINGKKDSLKGYSLRIKKTNPEILGIDKVDQYAGYLDVENDDKHFFYWFFESRNDPKNDPIILWLNGGPGCSSLTGLFFELGPSSITQELKPKINPFSWNSNASIIFLDQPVGVGFSYSSSDKRIGSTDAAGKDVYAFLELFFLKFPQYSKNKFHIAGESYGGHYVPKFASEIISHQDRSFDLTSVLIGNGMVDPKSQFKSYKPMACGEGGYKQVISDEDCINLEKMIPRCDALSNLCYKYQSAFTCIPAMAYCSKVFDPYSKTGLNMYDIRVPCDPDTKLCYKDIEFVDQYLNLPQVQDALGVEVDEFTSCSDQVGVSFALTGDSFKPFQGYVAELLAKDIPVLIYSGDKDYICNWLGGHFWTEELEWDGEFLFRADDFKKWNTLNENQDAGLVKSASNFTFLRVFDAGHMVPYDKPANALDMLNRWINGDYTFGH